MALLPLWEHYKVLPLLILNSCKQRWSCMNHTTMNYALSSGRCTAGLRPHKHLWSLFGLQKTKLYKLYSPRASSSTRRQKNTRYSSFLCDALQHNSQPLFFQKQSSSLCLYYFWVTELNGPSLGNEHLMIAEKSRTLHHRTGRGAVMKIFPGSFESIQPSGRFTRRYQPHLSQLHFLNQPKWTNKINLYWTEQLASFVARVIHLFSIHKTKTAKISIKKPLHLPPIIYSS